VDCCGVAAGVEDAEVGGVGLGLGEVVLADLFVVVEGALLDAVLFNAGVGVVGEEGELGADAGAGEFDGEVEEEGEVGPAVFDGDVADGADVGGGEAVAAELVGEGGGDEAVAEDELPGGEGGEDVLLHHLGAGGHVEEHLAAHVHFVVFGVEEDLADLLADAGRAGVADEADVDVIGQQAAVEELGLGGLTGAFGAVDDEEFSAQVLHPGGILRKRRALATGLIRPGYSPS